MVGAARQKGCTEGDAGQLCCAAGAQAAAFRGNFHGGEGQVGEVQAAAVRVMHAC